MSHSGVEPIDELFSRGGMASLLTTVWLVLAAMAFAAILEHAGFLRRLLEPVVVRARSRGSLILAVNASAIGLNATAGDQYVADVLPSRAVHMATVRRPLSPVALTAGASGLLTLLATGWPVGGRTSFTLSSPRVPSGVLPARALRYGRVRTARPGATA